MAIGPVNVREWISIEIALIKELGVANYDLGKKLSCQSCGVKFYDLKKKKPVCPACETEYVPAKPKMRRAAPEPAKPVPPKPEPEAAGKDKTAAAKGDEAVAETEDAGGANDDSLMEDTSDIGGDDNDVAGVMENVDGEGADK